MEPTQYIGVLPDERPQEEKDKDFTHEEVAKGIAVEWKEKDDWTFYDKRDQSTSGSCVGQSLARIIGIETAKKATNFYTASAAGIYKSRVNYPSAGMNIADVWKIGCNRGAESEAILPSQNMTEEQLNAVKIPEYDKAIADDFRIGNYLYLYWSLNNIASVLEANPNTGVLLCLYSNVDEYRNVSLVVEDKNLKAENADVRHAVVAVDYCEHNGVKGIIIEDSYWHIRHNEPKDDFEKKLLERNQRFVTEEFITKRIYSASYPTSFVYNQSVKPQYSFEKNLQFGDRNEEVNKLQKALQSLGYFPSNVDTTEYYGALTSRGVLAFQIGHLDEFTETKEELEALQGHHFGPETRKALSKL